nr:MAG TPA: adenine-specific methyltransferase [Caudoviricetes sp.]
MANDWSGNGKSVFVTLGASNHTDKEREPNDFYATDPIAIDKLIGSVGFIPSIVWECACGTGCLSERLKKYCHVVVSTDVVDRGYGQVQDFLLAKEMPSGCSCIITNPPYKLATEFILHALDLLPDGGRCMMFLKTTFLEGEKRHRLLFSKCPPQRILQFSKRVLCAKNAEFQKMCKVGSAVSYAWFVWEKGYKGETTITWI